MRTNRLIFSIAVGLISFSMAGVLYFFIGGFLSKSEIKVVYPTTVFKSSEKLVDPANLETIWEYYLVENISCGLVRDSQVSPTGFSGCLAENFYKVDTRTWVFKLRENRWSDGSLISNGEIRNWLENLKFSKSRHLKTLKQINKINFREETKEVSIIFNVETDESVLHELSLAEAGLFPTDFEKSGWRKTSGPYFVDMWDFEKKQLRLTVNQFSTFFSENIPANIVLKTIEQSDREKLFKEIQVNLVPLSPQADPIIAEKMLRNAPQIWISQPMMVFFFHFNYKNVLTHDIQNRELFNIVVQEIKKKLFENESDSQFRTVPEDQIIPIGFSGRLNSIESLQSTSLPISKLEKIKIKMHSGYKNSPLLLKVIEETFKKHGIEAEFVFRSTTVPDFDLEDFAGLYSFAGNQKDSTGSWSFLTSSPNGVLSDWKNVLSQNLDDTFEINKFSEREERLKELHRAVLGKFLLIPLMIGSQRYLISSDLDVTKWNRFDARLRFYEMKWK